MTTGVCEVEIENGNFFSGGSVDAIGDKGFENGGKIVNCSGLVTGCIVLGSEIAKDDQLKVNEKANVEKEEVDINGVSQESLSKVNGSENMVVEVTDLDSGKIINSNYSLIPIESSKATYSESDSSPRSLEDSKSQDIISQLSPSLVEDKDEPKFLIEDTEFVESAVKLQENVEIIDDDKESQIVPVTETQSADVGDDKQIEFEVNEAPILIFPETLASPELPIQFGSFGLHEKDVNSHHGYSNVVMEVSSEVIETEVPRFDDEKLKEQIKNARMQLVEKERCRDAIGVEIKEKGSIVESHYDAFQIASLEVIAARKLRSSKQAQLESIQSLMNKVKNAEDIDNRMHNVEHMIETRNQRYKIQDCLNNLQKEVESLKENVSKAEADVLAKGKTYEEENKKGEELVAQFRAAQKVCQQAYEHLYSLKKRLYHKNKCFYMYKEDATVASNFESGGDKAALHLLCANQVEGCMEERNSHDEFRDDDINRIKPSTIDETLHVSEISESVAMVSKVKGKKTLSSPDNQTIVKVVSKVEGKKTLSPPGDQTTVKVVSKVEEGKKTVSPPNNQTMVKVDRKANREMKTKEPVTFIVKDSKFVCLSEIMEDEEKERTVKVNELSEKEIECKLKEQIRLEEKKKMDEATVRKKRNAKKAQKRAEMRAQKEAEHKEKAREKRLRKKERKRTSGDSSSNSSSSRMTDEKIVKLNEANEIDKTWEVTPTSLWWPWKTVTALVRVLCSF